MSWDFNSSVFYQFYPMGFCGAPQQNDGVTVPRIRKVMDWIPHLQKLGVGAVYFSPLFDSDSHGYDTRDYRKLDCRLGTNEDFKQVCDALHQAGIKVILDGVFNHVGRGFWAFQDVLKNREASPYCSWFHLDFPGNSNYNDGLWYEGWEGHFELVKLNLGCEETVSHLLDCVRIWIEEFGIDGLRLDVAYLLSPEFLRRLRAHCDGLKEDFFLMGELLHGDYNQRVGEGMLDSCTNYECYKGLYSSFNSLNLFEITHSLLRQFGDENWTLYRGKHLVSFVDNHDVSRIASMLQNPAHLPLIYALLFGMPGIPCLYYGSEWGAPGRKEDGDWGLRPAFEQPEWNPLTEWLHKLCNLRSSCPALSYGSFRSVVLQNKQVIFERKTDKERILVAINLDDAPFTAHFDAGCGQATDLLTGELHDFGGGSTLPPCSASFWKCER